MLWYHFAKGLREGREYFKWCNSYRVARESEGVDGPQEDWESQRVSKGVINASEGVVIISKCIVRTKRLVRASTKRGNGGFRM